MGLEGLHGLVSGLQVVALCRDFTADRPGVKLVGDITYIPTWQGWLFLATVIDCYTGVEDDPRSR